MPTSDAAKFLMKGASVIADVLGDEPDRRYARPGDEVVIGQTSAEAVRLSRRHQSGNGGRGWNRTTNLSIKSRMLCQLSYASGRVEG